MGEDGNPVSRGEEGGDNQRIRVRSCATYMMFTCVEKSYFGKTLSITLQGDTLT